MNAAKDNEKEVDQRRIRVGAKEKRVLAEPQLLKTDLAQEGIVLQRTPPETTTREDLLKPMVPVAPKRNLQDETEIGRANKHARRDVKSRSSSSGSSRSETGTDKPASTDIESEKSDAESNKKVGTNEEDVSTKKTVELDLTDESDNESVPPGEKAIRSITEKDVLCGRGGATNVHPGNKKFRDIVDQNRREYLAARKSVKPLMNRAVVKLVRKDGGRFLKCERDGLWYEIGDPKAQEKVGQAFRQKAPEMRKLFFKEEPKEKKVSKEELRQVQEQQQQQQHLEQIQQQHQQQQMALARAAIGTVPPVMDPSTLALMNPLFFQQAMANPMLHVLLALNNSIVTMNPALNPAPPAPAPANGDASDEVNLSTGAMMGKGGFLLPRPPKGP